MAFKFKLETVLRHRKNIKDMALKELTEAEHQLQEHLDFISSMYEKIDETRQLAVNEQRRPGFSTSLLQDMESFVLSLKNKIEVGKQQAREYMQVVEDKRAVLIEKAKEFKAIEHLKEKQNKEYLVELKKNEQKKLDDQIQMRFKRKSAS